MSKEILKTAIVGGIWVVAISYLAIRLFWPDAWLFVIVLIGSMTFFLPWKKIHRRVNKLSD